MKKYVVIIVMLVGLGVTNYSQGQVSVTAYTNDVLGLGFNHGRLFSAELKFITDKTLFYSDGIVELDGFLNFKQKSFHQLAIGFGVNFDLYGFNGVTMPINLNLYPFKDLEETSFLNRMSFVVQLCPKYDYELDFSTLVGVRYEFSCN